MAAAREAKRAAARCVNRVFVTDGWSAANASLGPAGRKRVPFPGDRDAAWERCFDVLRFSFDLWRPPDLPLLFDLAGTAALALNPLFFAASFCLCLCGPPGLSL